MSTILDEILSAKREKIEIFREINPEDFLLEECTAAAPPLDFRAALMRTDRVGVIAEMKQASPSAGMLKSFYSPVAIARSYAGAGADAVSVLAEEMFFRGSVGHLRWVREVVNLPILLKDFVIDRYQILEARAHGADAVLLIAELLPGDELARFCAEVRGFGMQSLVEFHNAEQLPRVLECGADMIGINNRDLRTFATRLDHTLELIGQIPPDRVVVSESGIREPEDLRRLRAAGVAAVLVGEVLMRADDPGAALAALIAA